MEKKKIAEMVVARKAREERKLAEESLNHRRGRDRDYGESSSSSLDYPSQWSRTEQVASLEPSIDAAPRCSVPPKATPVISAVTAAVQSRLLALAGGYTDTNTGQGHRTLRSTIS